MTSDSTIISNTLQLNTQDILHTIQPSSLTKLDTLSDRLSQDDDNVQITTLLTQSAILASNADIEISSAIENKQEESSTFDDARSSTGKYYQLYYYITLSPSMSNHLE